MPFVKTTIAESIVIHEPHEDFVFIFLLIFTTNFIEIINQSSGIKFVGIDVNADLFET
jgi:hypothetical protein